MRKAKIVCTLGPTSRSEGVIERLVEAGVDVFRLNFSHGTGIEHSRTVQRVRKVSERLSRPVAILQDLQGPRIRVGRLKEEPVDLKAAYADYLSVVPER